jgi:DNA-binding NarL/FixJ family response regulator
MIRVLVAENSRIHTRLLTDALKRDPLLTVTPFESRSSSLVSTVAAKQIDVALIGSRLDDQPSRGFEILHELRSSRKETRAVMLLGSSKEEMILSAFRAGARGLFTENDPLELLTECVHSVYQGNIWANRYALGVAVEALANSPNVRPSDSNGMKLLSKRELQVVRCLAEGLTNREIAEQLNLSPHTIKNYLFRIFDKLGVSSRIEVLFMSLSQAEVPPSVSKLPTEALRGAKYSDSEAAFLEKSAEAGFPAAQLALAQLYLFRRNDPQDLVNAYTWYLVATERAMLARGLMTNLMAPEQIDEAKHNAIAWLSKMRRIPPSSASLDAADISNPPDQRRRLP